MPLPSLRPAAAMLGVFFLPLAASADSAVRFDAGKGCGRAAAFGKSGKAADLPGCSGSLPKDAPVVEQVLQSAKRDLLEAETLLGKNKLDKLDALLAAVLAQLTKTPPLDPELPDRWDQALPLYRRAVATLQSQRLLQPYLEKLRGAHRAAVESGQRRNRAEVEGGPAETIKAAAACLGVLHDARAANVDLSIEVELDKGRPRSLQEIQTECDLLRKSAESLARVQENALKSKRAQWRRPLKGERLKVFDAHPSALPEFDGREADWKGLSRTAVWKYPTAAGVEVYTFKGNKLTLRSGPPHRR